MKPASQSFQRYPLSVIFDSPATVRVLRALARHGGMLSASTLVDATRLTKPSVLSALRQLVETRTVEVLGTDRQRLYRFDESSRLGAALSALFAVESERYREVIEAVRASAHAAGAEAAWIYGSVARGEDRPGSDVDVAVACSSDTGFDIAANMRDALSGAERDLGFSASVIGIDDDEVGRLDREEDPWWLAIKREAITAMGPAPESYFDRTRRKRRKIQ